MAINLTTDLNVTTGGKLTDIGQIQGGWKTVAQESDMNALTASATLKGKLQNGQMFYVSSSATLYTCKIVGSGPFATYSFNQFVWPGAETVELNTFTGSIQTEVDSLTAVTGSYSTTSSVNTISSSIAVDITALQAFSSSLNATFATDAEVLQAVSFLNAATGSYAVTGSNTFTANQTIDGILILTTQSIAPSVEPGGLYIDSSYNLWIGDNLI